MKIGSLPIDEIILGNEASGAEIAVASLTNLYTVLRFCAMP